MMKVVSIVGMAGSGKSEVAKIFERNGFVKVRFGDITDREIRKRGLELNEENERYIRQQLRKEHGMAAYAKLSLPEVDRLLKSADVIVDGLYSWEEYTLLKSRYGDHFTVVAVWASPETRYEEVGEKADHASNNGGGCQPGYGGDRKYQQRWSNCHGRLYYHKRVFLRGIWKGKQKGFSLI